jgi:hypothetical protein
MGKTGLINFLLVLGQAITSQATCSREQLQATSDVFLSKGAVSSLKIASTAKIAQNNVLVKSIKETIIGDNTGQATPFKLMVLDEAKCNVAFMTVLNAPKPLLTSVRAQLAQSSGEVTEIEILKSSGKGAAGPGGAPQTVQTPSQFWSAPLQSGSKAQISRDQMVKILDSYPSGIQARSGKNVQTTPDCARMENGMKMPFKCNQSFEALGFPVTNRAYYVDTKTGISLAKFYFDQSRMALWLHEYMKITDEKITEIQAVYITPNASSGQFHDILNA